MSSDKDIPDTWKFGTLQEDGSILVEWHIREPFRSMGYIMLHEKDKDYAVVYNLIKDVEPGRRSSLGNSMEDLVRRIKEEEASPEFQEILKRDAAVLDEIKKKYPYLNKELDK